MSEHIQDPEKKEIMVDEEKHRRESVTEYIDELEQAYQADISITAILNGTAAAPLTTFEKKAALINAELDKFGMGRYQWCIWFLCGFGYFLDLAWAEGVGLGAISMYQEFGVPAVRQGDIFSCANAGLAIGALAFGLLVDVIGRKWAFNLTCLICSFFGLFLAAPHYNYGAMCALYLLSCIGLGGNIPIDAAITLEFLPQGRRNLVALLSMWQPIGVVVAAAVAYGTTAKWRCPQTTPPLPSCDGSGLPCCEPADNMGWRYEFIILGLLTLAVFFLRFAVFNFYESPKYLLGKGREAEAIEVLHKIAKFNKVPPPTLTLEMFAEIDAMHPRATDTIPYNNKQVVRSFFAQFSHLKELFTRKLQLFIFILMALAYMGDYWSFNLAGSFLPIILNNNNVSSGRNDVTETYRQYIYIYLPGIIGAFLALGSIQLPIVGRKWSLVLSAAFQGLSMAMYTQVKTTAGYVGLNALEYIMQTFFNAVLYASAPELFDTIYRGSASGMLSCLGRLAGIVAPFAGAEYLASESSGILWLGAGGIWLSAFVMIFLPVEMRNRQMF